MNPSFFHTYSPTEGKYGRKGDDAMYISLDQLLAVLEYTMELITLIVGIVMILHNKRK